MFWECGNSSSLLDDLEGKILFQHLDIHIILFLVTMLFQKTPFKKSLTFLNSPLLHNNRQGCIKDLSFGRVPESPKDEGFLAGYGDMPPPKCFE